MPFEDLGYVVVDGHLDMRFLNELFETRYLSKFDGDSVRNRNLIKAFTNDLHVREILLAPVIRRFLEQHHGYPIITGPVVSHYTSTDTTGSAFGLPFHQDWPSMATSSRSIICWIPLRSVNTDTHSIEVVPGSHLNGALPGQQLDGGYVVDLEAGAESVVLEVDMGQILFMSAWLVHRTHVNLTCPPEQFKLSLSLRFDDLEDPFWGKRDFVSAYENSVNRDLWLE